MTYKNRPLIRKDKVIYYGNMSDKFIIMLQIVTTKESLGDAVSDKIIVQLQSTDENASLKDRIIQMSEKNGLYDALDIADIWLTRALKN